MTPLETSRPAWAVHALLVAVLLGVEASYFAQESGPLREAAGVAWIALSVLILLCALARGLLPLFRGVFWRSKDVGWFLVAYLLPVVLVLFEVNGYAYTQVNDEGARQLGSGLRFMSTRGDLGIFSIGFLGYPARQYLLAALPSLVLGRSLAAWRLGFAGLYFTGYLAFLSGTLRHLEARGAPRPKLLAAMAGMFVSLSSYPLLYARLFEQSTIPLSLMLLFLAAVLLYLERPGPLPAVGLAWVLGLMPYAYTPALAAWGFGMGVVAWMAFGAFRARRTALLSVLACGAASLAVSLTAQAQAGLFPSRLQVGGFADLSPGDWAYRITSGLHATVGLEESLIPAPLVLGVLFILVHSLARRDLRVPYLCVWTAGTVLLSLALKGYCWREPEFDIHRAMVVLPPLSLALVMYLAAHPEALSPPASAGLLRGLVMGAIVLMILNSAYLPFIRRAPRSYFPYAVTDQEEAAMLVVRKALPGAKTVYLVPPLFCPLEDTLSYFAPETRVVRGQPRGDEHKPGNYLITYIKDDPYARVPSVGERHLNPRPFLRILPE